MRPIRLVVWNVEWFDGLFRDDGTPDRAGPGEPGGASNARRLDAVAHVLRWLDADAVLVVEAPDEGRRRSTRRALEGFAAAAGLRATRTIIGFPSPTHQELALMHDPAVVEARHAPGEAPDAPRFDGTIDLGREDGLDALGWSKPPLELALRVRGVALHLVGVHAKSKSLRGATGAEARRVADLNRRKQQGQCLWLRRRIDARLAEATPLVVAGDLNDGPGLDRAERASGRSSVEIVLGRGAGRLVDPHAVAPRTGRGPTTARFRNAATGGWRHALLDYAMVSAALAPLARWRILHPEDDAEAAADPTLRASLLAASDHFPVVLDLALPPPTSGT